jgi:putative membrane protein
MMTGFGMGWGGLWMMLFMLLFWILILGGAVWLLAALFPRVRSTHDEERPADTALTILQERYARGELGKEEFEAMRRDLQQ